MAASAAHTNDRRLSQQHTSLPPTIMATPQRHHHHREKAPRVAAAESTVVPRQHQWQLESHQDGEATTDERSVPALQTIPHDSQAPKLCAAHVSTVAHVWQYTPYEATPNGTGKLIKFAQNGYFRAAGQRQVPENLEDCAYAPLAGVVQFVPFPPRQQMWEVVATHRERMMKAVAAARVSSGGAHQTHEIFFGQNRFDITADVFEWVINEVLGCDAFRFDIVTKKNDVCRKTLPTGGIRAWLLSPEAWKIAVSVVNKRVMIDRTGVWYASTEDECAAMAEYCREICAAAQKGTRLKNVPNNAITAELPKGCKRR